ncbi:MAG: orotidine-5'-phosphate decarboxylase [Myxococcota bacterium]
MSLGLIKRVIPAIDIEDFETARSVVDNFSDDIEYVKIGMQAFYGYGERIIPYLQDKGLRLFLDLKLCDIPNTVSSAIRSLVRYRFDMLTVHISGGEKMLLDSTRILKELLPDAGLIGVTILTSLGDKELSSLGYRDGVKDAIQKMCKIALDSGLYGIVCSAKDLDFVKPIVNNRLKIITPGIRLADENSQDQIRVETPLNAFRKGSDYIVMGRSLILGDIRGNLERLRIHLLASED